MALSYLNLRKLDLYNFLCSFRTMGQCHDFLIILAIANEITRTHEAKRFYALFGLLANIALIFSGQTVKYMSDIRDTLPEGVDAWGVSLKYMMTAVVAAGILVIFINYWMEKNVLSDPKFYDAAESAKTKKPKKKK